MDPCQSLVHRARLDRLRKTELRSDSAVDILVAQSLVGALPSNGTAASADCVPAVDSLFTVAVEVSMDVYVGFPRIPVVIGQRVVVVTATQAAAVVVVRTQA